MTIDRCQVECWCVAISGLSTGIDLASRHPRDLQEDFTSEYRERLERELEGELERRAAQDAIADVVDLSQTQLQRAREAGDVDATDPFLDVSSTTRAYSSPPDAIVRGELAEANAALESQPSAGAIATEPAGVATSGPDFASALAAYSARPSGDEQAASRRLSVRA